MKQHVELLERRASYLLMLGWLARLAVLLVVVVMVWRVWFGASAWLLLAVLPLVTSSELLMWSSYSATTSAYQIRLLYSMMKDNQPPPNSNNLAPRAPDENRLVWEPVGMKSGIPRGRNGLY